MNRHRAAFTDKLLKYILNEYALQKKEDKMSQVLAYQKCSNIQIKTQKIFIVNIHLVVILFNLAQFLENRLFRCPNL